MKKVLKDTIFVIIISCLLIILSGCDIDEITNTQNTTNNISTSNSIENVSENQNKEEVSNNTSKVEETKNETNQENTSAVGISESTYNDVKSNLPQYSGSPYVKLNNNIPYFTSSEITTSSYEKYSPLDYLGRCGVAVSCIGKDLMPTESRGSIGDVRPSGWHTVRYNGIDGNYLYNRCHLIGFQLTGENANTRNLITGTRYLNISRNAAI